MKRIITALSTIIALSLPAMALAASWTIDPEHSHVGFKVRHLMVDAPEITQGHDDCHGAEARDFNRRFVEGREVLLRYDAECTDRYDRLLAYVSVDGREVNTALVELGYACTLHVPPNGDARAAEFDNLELRAASEQRGLWSHCDARACR